MLLLTMLVNLGLNSNTMLTSLKDAQVISTKSIIKKNSAIILFKPNCMSCRIQIKNLDCLKDKFDITLLGAFGTEGSLRKEYLKYYSKFKAFYANSNALEGLGIRGQATPKTIIIKEKKQFKFIGTKTCQSLLNSVGYL